MFENIENTGRRFMEKNGNNIRVLLAPPKGKLELESYITWLNQEGFDVDVLSEDAQVIYAPLILAGGADIGKNQERDTRELKWIKLAIEAEQPIIGICRGMQLLNHYFGGEVSNIDTTVCEDHTADNFETDEDHSSRISQYHWVMDLNGHMMSVNSRHHQYCSIVASNFKVPHVSSGLGYIPESIEDVKRNIWGVQWHPERYEIQDNNYPLDKLKNI